MKPAILQYIFVSLIDICRLNKEKESLELEKLLTSTLESLVSKFEKMFVKKDCLKSLDFIFDKGLIGRYFDDISHFRNDRIFDDIISKTSQIKKSYGKDMNNNSIRKYLEFLTRTFDNEVIINFSKNELFELAKICAEI